MKETNEKEGRSLGTIIKIILIILMISFFFPFCTVSCSGKNIEVTGVESTFGLEVLGEKVDGNLLCGLLFVVPVVLLACAFFANKIHTQLISNMVGAVVNLIILIIYKTRVNNLVEEYLSTVEFEFGYYTQIILNILLIILSFIYLRSADINNVKVETPEEANRKGYIFLVLYCVSVIGIVAAIVLHAKSQC